MSSHALDSQMEERLVDTVTRLERQLKELRTLQNQGQDAVNLQVSNAVTISNTFSPGDRVFFVYRFDNPQNKQLFSNFEFSLYEGTIAAGNELGNGLNIYGNNWKWSWWRSQWDSDGNNQRDWVEITNTSGSTLTLHGVGQWRYLVSSGVGSA